MTLFIVFIATVNIVFGYGLAVYMGHGQLPWAVGTLTLPRFGSKSSDASDQVSAEDTVESVEEAKEKAPIEAAPPVAPKVEQVVVEEKNPEPAIEPVSQVAEVAETPIEIPETKVKAAEAPEAVVPEEAKDEPQAVESEPVVAVEEPQEVVETESETPAAEVADPSPAEDEEEVKVEEVPVKEVKVEATAEVQEQSVPEATADSSDQPATAVGEVDEKFLEGIAAFQSQLEKQVDEPAAESEPETAQGVAAPTDAQESSEEQTSSKGDDVLAGIESFRAQLATMHQDSEAVEEEPAAQPAS